MTERDMLYTNRENLRTSKFVALPLVALYGFLSLVNYGLVSCRENEAPIIQGQSFGVPPDRLDDVINLDPQTMRELAEESQGEGNGR